MIILFVLFSLIINIDGEVLDGMINGGIVIFLIKVLIILVMFFFICKYFCLIIDLIL